MLACVSRVAAVLIGIASAAGLFAAGCSSSRGVCGTCPNAVFDLHSLDDGAVTWSVAGAPPETAASLVPNPPSPGQCAVRYSKGEVIDYPSANQEKVIGGVAYIQCASVGGGGFVIGVRDPGDLRSWQASSWQMAAAKGSVIADVGPSSGLGCNGLYFDQMELTVTVETATGGAAPFPQVVTDDFARTFRLDFDTSTVTPVKNGNPCDASVSLSAQVSVHLTQTAADYAVFPNASCGCE